MKKNAKGQPYVTASTKVQQALIDQVGPTAPTESFPNISTLKRITNKSRHINRPTNPSPLDFVLDDTAGAETLATEAFSPPQIY
ncbi:hypothetical protein LSH36_32g20024 [Paralvinella palmiformis]|uniref:Uncharacterized protein n=1 Tax=Paralvinella palmiformis TaxID=53620 RepID=A0AAD9KAX5_9ANNE|nr:hypothetical protein LSH36_32g20024 [Paralvinella palmiformis]